MTYSIVYSNPDGNTKLLADVIYNNLDKSSITYFGLPCEEALRADIIFIGFWTNRGMCDDVCKEFLARLSYQRIVLFGSAGFGLSDDYFHEILAETEKLLPNGVDVLDTFMCQGRMKMSVREKYLLQKELNPNNPKIDMMIKNFDMALKHPDSNDLLALKNMVIRVR